MTQPRIIPASEHGISRAGISRGAIEVIDILKSAGFSAELVGGCVRDLLLGIDPNDFDVSTNATPEQTHRLFRRCRVIGRRFRLAEIRVGRELIQVATYRASPKTNAGGNGRRNISGKGKILKDNRYGDIEQDAFRRDLTINALYLHPSDMSIVDYVGGYDDASDRIVRVIGNPTRRYREDPVRMLRAVRFAAALDFQINPESSMPVPQLSNLLADVPNSRLTDEIAKLFFDGRASATFELLKQFGIFSYLFPVYANSLGNGVATRESRWLSTLFEDTDYRVQSNVHTSFVYTLAAILWLPFHTAMERKSRRSKHPPPANQIALDILLQQTRRSYLSKHQSARIQEIWNLQRILEEGRSHHHDIVENRCFRPALRLLELRSKFGDVDSSVCEPWVAVRSHQLRTERARSRRRGRRQRKA